MNELEIITEDAYKIQLAFSTKRDKVLMLINESNEGSEYAETWINLSQAKQIVNFLNQVL